MEQLGSMPATFKFLPHHVALTFAYVLALPIGWDREKEERMAVLRTFPLVAVASWGFIQATEGIVVNSPEAQARIVECLITGFGFIGGGRSSGRVRPCMERRQQRASGPPEQLGSPSD
ncbi:MAG: MgtC/SapB family protein [Burkholderiales bacterium]|nr:MgtC/SapB family protein [Burkholderiales bacterium]